ncbi:hypothetical protein [Carboxylicivirga taeanensis]|uniref:hypothetical protein n=1 Tax=Carboxylicivirga taeanensis TaxID=1416875 RepID=UPI003F6DE5EF
MKQYCIIMLFSLTPISLIAQNDCTDFNDYNSSQVWIQKIIKLGMDAQKDSALQRIKCERIIGENNINFPLLCIVDGLIAPNIPDYRDCILRYVDSKNMQLIGSLCEVEGIYPEKCNLGFLIISGLEKPVVNNIKHLTIKKIERKKGEIRIVIKNHKSCDFDIRIEDFSDANNFKTEKKHLKRGNNRIKYSVDNEVKLITILDNEDKLILIK